MRLLMQTLLLVWWGVCKQALAGGDVDHYAAVPGTGWTDISKLQSTCSKAGYFVNPNDCSKFYVCVDHSTEEHQLLLRYDFDCPGGLAFDESTKNCNYPGPNGCVTSSSGWGSNNGGWNQGSSGGWNSGHGNSGGWNSGHGNSGGLNSGHGNSGGWNSGHGTTGIFQSAKVPSWGTQTKYPVVSHGTTIVHVPSSGGTIIRGSPTPAPYPSPPRISLPTPTPYPSNPRISLPTPTPYPSNPRITLPATSVVQVPVTNFESFRLRPLTTKVFQSPRVVTTVSSNESGGWSPSVPANANVIIQHGGSDSGVTWGSSKVVPVNTAILQTVRVTPAPPVQWETPKAFPQSVKVVEGTDLGWSHVRVTHPTPTPVPANPTVKWESARITPLTHAPPVSWQEVRQTHHQPQPRPDSGWTAPRVTHVVQPRPPIASNPSHNFIHTSPPQFPPSSFNFVESGPQQVTHQPVTIVQPSPPPPQQSVNLIQAHPQSHQSVHLVQAESPHDDHDHHHVHHDHHHFVQQINDPPSENSVQEHSAPANPTVTVPAGWENVRITQLPSGYIWQSSPNLQSSQSDDGDKVLLSTPITPTVSPSPNSLSNSNFGIIQQVINENHQGHGEDNGKSHIQQIYENKERQLQNDAAQSQAAQELTSQDPANPVYQFISPPGSGLKGRIIVLYAPLTRGGGKRDVPVIEVEVEDDNDNNGDDDSQNT